MEGRSSQRYVPKSKEAQAMKTVQKAWIALKFESSAKYCLERARQLSTVFAHCEWKVKAEDIASWPVKRIRGLQCDLDYITHDIQLRSIDLREKIFKLEQRLGLNPDSSQDESGSVSSRPGFNAPGSAGGGRKRKADGSLDVRAVRNRKLLLQQLSTASTAPRPQQHAFWNSMAPYFGDISRADVDRICSIATDEEALMHVPPLGQHFTQTWASEDQRMEGRRRAGESSNNAPGTSVKKDGVWLHGVHPVFSSFPPLMRRLFDALADHNIVKMSWRTTEASAEATPARTTRQSTASNRETSGPIEGLTPRLLRRLSGVLKTPLSTDDRSPREHGQDELLQEMKQAQTLLRAQVTANRHARETIQRRAEVVMKEQKLRKKVQEADAAVRVAYDAYKRKADEAEFLAREALSMRTKAMDAWRKGVLELRAVETELYPVSSESPLDR